MYNLAHSLFCISHCISFSCVLLSASSPQTPRQLCLSSAPLLLSSLNTSHATTAAPWDLLMSPDWAHFRPPSDFPQCPYYQCGAFPLFMKFSLFSPAAFLFLFPSTPRPISPTTCQSRREFPALFLDICSPFNLHSCFLTCFFITSALS